MNFHWIADRIYQHSNLLCIDTNNFSSCIVSVSGKPNYSKVDKGHYILFGAIDSYNKIKSVIDACYGKIDWSDIIEYLGDVYDVVTRTASYNISQIFHINRNVVH